MKEESGHKHKMIGLGGKLKPSKSITFQVHEMLYSLYSYSIHLNRSMNDPEPSPVSHFLFSF